MANIMRKCYDYLISPRSKIQSRENRAKKLQDLKEGFNKEQETAVISEECSGNGVCDDWWGVEKIDGLLASLH